MRTTNNYARTMVLLSSLLLGLLFKTTNATTSCPEAGAGPQAIQFNTLTSISPQLSVASTVCVLVHVRPKDPTTTPAGFTATSHSSDYILAPVSRSYDGKPWEKVAGPFQQNLDIVCSSNQCGHTLVSLTSPYDSTGEGAFYLIAYDNPKTFDEELVRFFSQSTYGATRDMMNTWKINYANSIAGMAQWVKDQMTVVPATSLRAKFRQNADFSLQGNGIDNASVTPRNPCQKYSRWRDYMFTGDDFGKNFDVQNTSDGKLLVVLDGTPRGVVDSFVSDDGSFNGPGKYTFGYRAAGEVGGIILASEMGKGKWKSVQGGNPLVVFNDAVLAGYPEITLISLPTRDNFEQIPGVYAPGLERTPVSGSFRLNMDLTTTTCNNLPTKAYYSKVLGKIEGEENYFWYDAYAVLENNTPDTPIADGGKSKIDLGVDRCINVNKNFLNYETCHLAQESACTGSNSIKDNAIVCGSPNEVANIPNLPASQTNAFQFSMVSNPMFFSSFKHIDPSTSFITTLTAEDQLRHRVAWALAELIVVTLNQIDNGEDWSEMFLNYKDIFVRNAFGNYRDILREVTYSPMMAEMLSHLDQTSSMYALLREGRVSRPDENYAREIMQLFSIGLYELNIDGTYKLDSDGQVLQTYDNTDIQTFARAMTGFQRQQSRSNYEGYRWNPNKIDPLSLNGSRRDAFPKMDLNEGFLGDGYPLCAEIPSRSFLKKGAKYRLVGNWNRPELTSEPSSWENHASTTRTELDSDSQLYQSLCNSDGVKCNYQMVVQLDQNLDCKGVECEVDTLSLIKIENNLYYEFMPFPCIELGFSTQAKKVVDRYHKAMCADPLIKDVVHESCCPDVSVLTSWWQDKALSYCKYSGEKMSYSSSNSRCEAQGGTICDWKQIYAAGHSQTCGLYHRSYENSFRWTNQSCTTQVKVEPSGLVSIVHNPNLDINSDLSIGGITLQEVHQSVSPSNQNFFKVKWDGEEYPSFENGCGISCTVLDDGCLCDIAVAYEINFSTFPTYEEVLSQLKIGSISLEWIPEYTRTLDSGGVQMFNKDATTNLYIDTIFGVAVGGETKFLLNSKSTVNIDDGSKTYSFRNPPSLMSIIDQKTIDAYYETEALMDMYMNHDNTPPFIASRMIKRFVTSNPSPGYIERVATVFKSGTYEKEAVSFGDSTRGSLEAMFAAILLDDEARTVVLDVDPFFGYLKEPILKLFAFMRAMEFTMNDRMPTLRMVNMVNKIGQEPFRTPNVFSSFMPEYSNPGAIQKSSLTSPEAQILNSATIVGFQNGIMSMIDLGLNDCYGGLGMRTVWSCGNFRNKYSPELYSNGSLRFNPSDDSTASAVVNELALLLTGGRLSDNSRTAIETAYNSALSSGDAGKALRMAQKLVVATPEFHSSGVFKPLQQDRPEPSLPSEPANAYKAVIYVNLDGGLDSFNTLVPHSSCSKDMYNEYKSVRGDIALDKSTLKLIAATGQVCDTFGLHPELSFIHELYNEGDLAFVANIGVLQQPISVSEKRNYRKLHDRTALFSHNTQQEEINSVDIFDDQAGQGILGRMADMLGLNGYTSGTVSVTSGAPALVSNFQPLILVNSNGPERFNPIPWEEVDVDVVKELNKATEIGSNVLSEVWAQKLTQTLSDNDLLINELNGASLEYAFPTSRLGKQMSTIAKLIKTRDVRRTDRDFFYAKIGGFDTHGQQDGVLSGRFREINGALSSFVREMKNQQLWDNVAVVFVSEFGRTLKANTGNGSDHAWAGNHFIASGDLKGGQIFGEYPNDLTDSGERIVGRGGVVIPSTPWEALWHGVAEWLGLYSDNDLTTVLPNRGPFEDVLIKGIDLFHSVMGSESPSVSAMPSESPAPSQMPSVSMMPSGSFSPTRETDSILTNFGFGDFWTAPESGIMFDINATVDVSITRLDIDLFYVNYNGITFPTEIEIYTKPGSFAGFQSQSSAWTKHLDKTTVLPPAQDDFTTTLTALKPDILPEIRIPGGSTLAIFITNRDVSNFIEMAANDTAMDYVSDDGIVTVKTGVFQRYGDFIGSDIGSWWGPVAFSGIIYYDNTFNDPTHRPSVAHSPSPSISVSPSLMPSLMPSEKPSISMIPSTDPSSKPSKTPSSAPSLEPSAGPTKSSTPSVIPSSQPSAKPSISSMPSVVPTSQPSAKPSISSMPSLLPSEKPSFFPSVKPSSKPSQKPSVSPSDIPTVLPSLSPSDSPSQLPSTDPSISPSKRPTIPPTIRPTGSPSKAPIIGTFAPTASPKPSASPTVQSSATPSTTVAPSQGPSPSPSVPIFETITTTVKAKSPFSGISPSDLKDRFAAIIALLAAVMKKLLGPDRSKWGVRVVSVGGIAARQTKSQFEEVELFAGADENSVEVEFEFTTTSECRDGDGCSDGKQSEAINEGLELLDVVETVVTTGQLQQTIKEESVAVGLSEVVTNLECKEIFVENPTIKIVDPTAYPSISTTFIPTSSPTYGDCEDSPFRFRVKDDGKFINRYCSWVRVKPNDRCKLPGIRDHCKKSCWKCTSCADSTLSFKFDFFGDEKFRSCDWAKTDTSNRCSAIEGISTTCPLTCETCKPACHDSPLRFKVKKGDKFINRHCSWVQSFPKRCSLEGVSSICPLTCGTCNTCVDSSLGFKLLGDKNERSCDWVSRKFKSRCSIEGVSRSCRVTCNTGSCCSDSTEQFEFTYKGNIRKKFCDWALRKDTRGRCSMTEVKRNCPKTCGKCAL